MKNFGSIKYVKTLMQVWRYLKSLNKTWENESAKKIQKQAHYYLTAKAFIKVMKYSMHSDSVSKVTWLFLTNQIDWNLSHDL